MSLLNTKDKVAVCSLSLFSKNIALLRHVPASHSKVLSGTWR